MSEPTARKAFLLRLDPAVAAAIEALAAQELRSVNGQIEWLLREALAKRGRDDQHDVAHQRAAPAQGRIELASGARGCRSFCSPWSPPHRPAIFRRRAHTFVRNFGTTAARAGVVFHSCSFPSSLLSRESVRR